MNWLELTQLAKSMPQGEKVDTDFYRDIHRLTGNAIEFLSLIPTTLRAHEQTLIKKVMEVCADKYVGVALIEEAYGTRNPTKALEKTVDLLERSRREFGINFGERHFMTGLAQENFANLDPAHNAQKPLAVMFHATYEPPSWEAAFSATHYTQQLADILEAYKTFSFDISTTSDCLSAIEQVGRTYGPIELVVLAGHGTKTILNWGYDRNQRERDKKPYDPDSLLSTKDEARLAEKARYLHPDAIIGLLGCSTGKGGRPANNLANTISRAWPNRPVYAPTGVANAHVLEFCIQDGRVAKIEFDRRKSSRTYIAKTHLKGG